MICAVFSIGNMFTVFFLLLFFSSFVHVVSSSVMDAADGSWVLQKNTTVTSTGATSSVFVVVNSFPIILWFVISNSTWYIASVLLIIAPTPVWTNAAMGRRPIERNGPSTRHNLSPRSSPK